MSIYKLHSKTALITGASGGLGEQFARCLHAQGARVILASRRLDRLKKLTYELSNAVAIKMNVSDKSSVSSCFAELEEAGEKIDICINNAAVLYPTPIFELNETNNFENIMQTNVIGAWYVLQYAANHMKNYKIHGSIINISSAGADKVSRANVSGYYASKSAIVKLTQNLVHELSPYNIRVNAILPGTIHTPMNEDRFKTQEAIQLVELRTPLKRLGKPKDLDGIILYLSSNEASEYVTGACFTIDGGMSWG